MECRLQIDNQHQDAEIPLLAFVGRCVTFSLDVSSVSFMKVLYCFCRYGRKGYDLSIVRHLCLLRKWIVSGAFLESLVAIQ